MAVEIVPIRENHIESFRQCLDGVAREKRFLIFTEAPPLESVREFVTGMIKKDLPQFVAVEEGTVVGWCDICPQPRAALSHGGGLGIGLDIAHRHQGLGRTLMTAALAKAKAVGIERIELLVYETNLNAIRLYESLGFQREGLKMRFAKLDGAYLNALIMALFP